MLRLQTSKRTRLAVVTGVLLLVALLTVVGSAAAHTPSCHQTAGADGPHYDDDPTTGSDAAFENNPTLGGDYPANAPGGCSVGNSQAPQTDS